jgi:hypothetical protein
MRFPTEDRSAIPRSQRLSEREMRNALSTGRPGKRNFRQLGPTRRSQKFVSQKREASRLGPELPAGRLEF